MTKLVLKLDVSYSQLCIFSSNLDLPFNDWSDRHVLQGFSWRENSVSFGTLNNDAHIINLFIDENVPVISECIVRAFRVPFKTSNGQIEVASIADSIPLKILPAEYILQVEFFALSNKNAQEVNVRLNQGVSDFYTLRADDEIKITDGFELKATPAS